MNKINLIALSLIIAYSINAQNYFAAPKAKSNKTQSNKQSKSVYLFEDFNNEFPSNWQIIDEGDDDYTWYIRTHPSNNLDGTPYLWIDSDEAGPGVLVQETIITNEFNTEGATNLLLAFDQRFNTLGNTDATVEVWDGTQWVVVLDNGLETGLVGSWGDPDKVMIDITSYANSQMKLKFYFSATFEWGWAIDNILVYEPDFETDLALTQVTPQQYLRKDSLYTPSISVHNEGITEITEFDATYKIWDADENLIVELTENITDINIVQNDNFYFIFSQQFSLPDSGNYTYEVEISYQDQENTDNNNLSGNLKVFREYFAFAVNSGSDKFEKMLAPFGESEIIGDIEAYFDFPMAIEFTKENLLLLRGSRQISEIDTLSGSETVLGTITTGNGTLTGLAYNPDKETYYVSLIAESNDASFIYELNIENLQTTLVGQFTEGQIIAIDYGTDGYIYGIDLMDDKLWRFNLSTNQSEEVGEIGYNLNFGQDITYNVLDDKIYGMLYYSGEYSSFLNIINTQTGNGTEIFDANGVQYSAFAMPLKGGTAEFYVHDNQSNAIENVSIIFNDMFFTTDEFGELTKFLPQGSYDFAVSKEGYDANTGSFTITNDETENIDIELTENVSINEQDMKISVYPNPTSDFIVILLVDEDNFIFELNDLTGKTLNLPIRYKPNGGVIDLSGLNSGIYLLNVKYAQKSKTIKVFKQ